MGYLKKCLDISWYNWPCDSFDIQLTMWLIWHDHIVWSWIYIHMYVYSLYIYIYIYIYMHIYICIYIYDHAHSYLNGFYQAALDLSPYPRHPSHGSFHLVEPQKFWWWPILKQLKGVFFEWDFREVLHQKKKDFKNTVWNCHNDPVPSSSSHKRK